MKNKKGTLTMKDMERLYEEVKKMTSCPMCGKRMEQTIVFKCKDHGTVIEG